MLPLKQKTRSATEKRVEAVLVIARNASALLQNREQLSSNILADIEGQIKRSFPLTAATAATAVGDTLLELDALGCGLWNAATSIRHHGQNTCAEEVQQRGGKCEVVLLRVFAFFLLSVVQNVSSRRSSEPDQRIRNFRLAIQACRCCLKQGELEMACKVLEQCSEYISASEKADPFICVSDTDNSADFQTSFQSLSAEYYLLRVDYSRRSERLDLAEHFLSKAIDTGLNENGDLVEKAADLLSQIGRSIQRTRLSDVAAQWHEKALWLLETCDAQKLSQDAAELRLCITASLIESLLAVGSPESAKRAQELVDRLSTDFCFASRASVHLMQLSVLLVVQPTNTELLQDVMNRTLKVAVLTDQTFKIVMQAIARVYRTCMPIAFDALSELLSCRLIPDLQASSDSSCRSQEFAEKVCITYILYAAREPSAVGVPRLRRLGELLDAVLQHTSGGFSAKATHAAQTLLWKATGTANEDLVDFWLDLLRHPIFNGAGQDNKAKIGRKAMSVALARNDLTRAREAFYQMSHAGQNESMTRYLAFKLALMYSDYELAKESLATIVKHAKSDQSFLYACVLEAQRSEMRPVAIAALQALLDIQPAGVHFSSLLRCTARLLVGQLDEHSQSTEGCMEEVLQVFENAAANITTLRLDKNDEWRAEMQWWSKSSFNVALRHCTEIHPEALARMLTVCTRFIDCYLSDVDVGNEDGMRHRKTICHFISASALIVLGRASDEGSEYNLQCYLQARAEIEAFKLSRRKASESATDDMHSKTFELLKFDLECVLNLQQWDQLDAALQSCLNYEHVDRWDTLADLVLITHSKTSALGINDRANTSMAALLQRIINDTWRKDRDIVKASRWLRLSISMDLNDGTGDFALKLLDQAVNMAKKGYHSNHTIFPETELQWLSSTAFNKAVDLLSVDRRDDAEVWISGALELARYAADNGALHAYLTYMHEQAKEAMKR